MKPLFLEKKTVRKLKILCNSLNSINSLLPPFKSFRKVPFQPFFLRKQGLNSVFWKQSFPVKKRK